MAGPPVSLQGVLPSVFRAWRAPALLGVLSFAVSIAFAGRASYWYDEAVTVMATRMPLKTLAHMCFTTVDAVHWAYYQFMWLWVRVFGRSELPVRAPSALGTAIAVAITVVIGRRLFSARVGIIAGIVVAFLPSVAFHAVDARSFSLAMAAAAAWTLAFIAAVTGTRRGRWWLYAALGIVATWLLVYTSLLLVAHVACLLVATRRGRPARPWARAAWRGFLIAACVTVLAAVPLGVMVFRQRGQISWVAQAGLNATDHLVAPFFDTSILPAVIAWVVILAGAVAAWIRHRRAPRRDPGPTPPGGLTGAPALTLVGGWLVGPQLIIMAVHLIVAPAFFPRYILFSAPAMALAVGVAAEAFHRRIITALCVIALVAACLPATVEAKKLNGLGYGGFDYRQAARYVADRAEPGDGVVFTTGTEKGADKGAAAYREVWASVKDVTLLRTAERRGTLADSRRTIPQALGHRGAPRRLWFVHWQPDPSLASDETAIEAAGYCSVSDHHISATGISLYTAC
jgi:mannosyltransferase